MKRFIFSAIALMVAATACTESGIIDTPSFYGNAIIFDTYIGKTPVTKAQNWGLAQLQYTAEKSGGVQIYAFYKDPLTQEVDYSTPYLNGNLLYSTTWGYYENSTLVDAYWPEGMDLAFAAYSLNAENTQNITYQSNVSTDKTEFDFTVQDVVSNQVDLLAVPFTSQSATPNSDTEVTLNFHHLLSRVGYKVYATNAGVDITIKSINFCGAFPKKGKVDLKSNPAAIQPYTGEGAEYAYSYEFFPSGESFTVKTDNYLSLEKAAQIYANASSTDATDCYMMIMPGQIDNAYIEVTYRLSGSSEDYYAKVDLGNWIFKAGYAYEFVFKIATAAIEFSGVVEGDWGSTPDVEKPLIP